jgi:hypothetical protein
MGKLCVEKRLWPQKLKNPINKTFGSKVIMFEEVLENKETIFLQLFCNKRFLMLKYGQLQKHS